MLSLFYIAEQVPPSEFDLLVTLPPVDQALTTLKVTLIKSMGIEYRAWLRAKRATPFPRKGIYGKNQTAQKVQSTDFIEHEKARLVIEQDIGNPKHWNCLGNLHHGVG
jgi:hypothetical protein